ncbi:hypothetical protein GCM10008983_18490 [Lentibacillus halophilus]|uniref:DUF4083 domain-containing protein n=1 Tax=Lentibacillus halophilus TaxID=295065 RepID=A0ABP3J4H9_9BACI
MVSSFNPIGIIMILAIITVVITLIIFVIRKGTQPNKKLKHENEKLKRELNNYKKR